MNTDLMNNESGKGIIFGILGILTLIIAIMGASLAYFTASAENLDDPIRVTAATVTITLLQGDRIEANELIPATKEVVISAYNRKDVVEGISQQCLDNKGYQVCSVFRFDADNSGGKNDQRIEGSIETITNNSDSGLNQEKEFENLAYTVYTVDNDGNRTEINTGTNLTKFAKTGYSTELFSIQGTENPNNYLIPAGEKVHFEVLIWLNEKAEDVDNDDGSGNQNDEQGLSYIGAVKVGIAGASDKITGEAIPEE